LDQSVITKDDGEAKLVRELKATAKLTMRDGNRVFFIINIQMK
jgi:hypothetical protein